jgi:hypothetical protein
MKIIFKLLLVVVILSNSNIVQGQTQKRDQEKPTVSKENRIPTAMFMSDFHIGEVYGSVTRVLPENDAKANYESAIVNGETIYYRKEVAELVNSLDRELGPNEKIPYLILMGDIFDMAIHNESDVLNLAHTFFNEIQFTQNKRTFISYFRKIIYLPGNHDHHVWKMLQEEYYISHQLVNNFKSLPIPQQAIGLLDLESSKTVIKDAVIFPDHPKNFLASVLSQNKKEVYIAYPNLYIKYKESNHSNEESAGICVTHGHFFEPGWNKSSLLSDNKNKDMNDSAYFSELEKNNSPLTEFSDFEVAQTSEALAQGISDLQFYQDAAYEQKYEKLSKLYPQLFPIKMQKSNKPKDFDILSLMKYPDLVDEYLMYTQKQMKHLKQGDKTYSLNLKKLVYGHTHVPCFNVKYSKHISNVDKTFIDLDLTIYNTGGWVNINDVGRPNPMFLYNDGGIQSVFGETF